MASMQQTRKPAEPIGHVTGRFANVQADQFRDTMEGLWRSAHSIVEAAIVEVEEQRISTIDGASVVANVTGSLFGWPEFHRELRVSDLASLSLSGYGNGQDGQ